MTADGHRTPAQIRASLDHPVIDGDGHWVEFDPVFAERMRKVGGDLAADGFLAALQTTRDALGMSVAERRRRRIAQPAFWSRQAENTLDRATAMLPRLLYERLPEFGTDFAIIYPTAGLRLPRIADDATRRAVIRAHNVVTADYFRPLADPAAAALGHGHPERAGNALARQGQGLHRRVAADAAELLAHERRELGPVSVRVDDRMVQAGTKLAGLGVTVGEHGQSSPGKCSRRDDTVG